jgi:hypothetical protein
MVAGFDADAFTASVLTPLADHAAALQALDQELAALHLPDSRWARELRDGFAVDALRAQFIHATYAAVVAKARGGSGHDELELAKDLFDRAKLIVIDRHSDLHDQHDRRLVERVENWGQYQYGYLFNTDTLCFWTRELAQVSAVLGSTTIDPPGCLF